MSAGVGFTRRERISVRRQSVTTCAAVSRLPSSAMKNPVPALPTLLGGMDGLDDGGQRRRRRVPFGRQVGKRRTLRQSCRGGQRGDAVRRRGLPDGPAGRRAGRGGRGVGRAAPAAAAGPQRGLDGRQEAGKHGAAQGEADRQAEQICLLRPHAGVPAGASPRPRRIMGDNPLPYPYRRIAVVGHAGTAGGVAPSRAGPAAMRGERLQQLVVRQTMAAARDLDVGALEP